MAKKINKSSFTRQVTVVFLAKYNFDKAFEANKNRDSERYRLVRENNNLKDSNAVAVYLNQLKVGYLRRDDASVVASAMDEGDVYSIKHNYSTKGDDYNKKFDNDYSDGYYRNLSISLTNESEYARATGKELSIEDHSKWTSIVKDPSMSESKSNGSGCLTIVMIGVLITVVIAIINSIIE